MKLINFTLAASLLALAACQSPSDPESADPAELNIDAANIETGPPGDGSGPPLGDNSVGELNEAEDSGSEDLSTQFIPAQYRGRWGMAAADCTSTRGDNKGLMTVGSTSIRFYESTAALQEQRRGIATSFAGLPPSLCAQ